MSTVMITSSNSSLVLLLLLLTSLVSSTVQAAEDDMELEGAADSSKPWGEVIVTALVINIITLTGVLFLSGEFVAKHVFKRDVASSSHYKKFTNLMIPSFACGALMATTVFLVLPEALYLISEHFEEGSGHEDHDDHEIHENDGINRFLRNLEEEDHEDHDDHAGAEAVWRFGTCILAGFLLPILTASFFPNHVHESTDASSIERTVEETETLQQQKGNGNENDISEEPPTATVKSATLTDKESDGSIGEESQPSAIDWPLASSIMAGDFFHNFADGIFVGTAFLLCARSLAITIAAATIYHEIAQEIADYFMLTRFCNIPPRKALCLNFINGFSVLLGAIVIVAVEDMTNVAIGSILAVSAGVYIYISVAECFPRAKAAATSPNDKIIALMAFIVGVVPIGLVLLNHQHCEAEHDH